MKEKRPKVVLLMKTHLKYSKLENLRRILSFDCVFGVDPVGCCGDLMLLWNFEVGLEIYNYSVILVDGF